MPVRARYVPRCGKKNGHISGRCTNCGHYRELALHKYAGFFSNGFPELKRYESEPARNKTSKKYRQKNIDKFHAAFYWCCVYCEGNRLAKEYRLEQIRDRDAYLQNPKRSADVEPEDDLVTPVSEILAPPSLQNIFDLVPDHVFPKWLQELPGLQWDPRARKRAASAWVVSAHRSCNSRRNTELDPPEILLFLYSRFLMPLLPGGDLERVQDAVLFAGVLHEIEALRATAGSQLTARLRRAT